MTDFDLHRAPVKRLTDEQLESERQRTDYSRHTVADEESPDQEEFDWCRYIDVTKEQNRRAASEGVGQG